MSGWLHHLVIELSQCYWRVTSHEEAEEIQNLACSLVGHNQALLIAVESEGFLHLDKLRKQKTVDFSTVALDILHE